MIDNPSQAALTETSPKTQDFMGTDEASESIAKALAQKPEFSDANPADLVKRVSDVLHMFRRNLSGKIKGHTKDADIRESLEILCSSPAETRLNRHTDLGINMHIPPEAVMVRYVKNDLANKKGNEHFHYAFNPDLIAPNVTRSDITQQKKPLTADRVRAAAAEGTMSQLIEEAGFNYVAGTVKRMLVDMAKWRGMTQEGKAAFSGILDAMEKSCREDTASGKLVQEEHLRRIERVRSMMPGQEKQ